MLERFINRIFAWFFMLLMGLVAGCCMRFEVVTTPDAATEKWIQQTTSYNEAVRTHIQSLDDRVQKLEQQKEEPPI